MRSWRVFWPFFHFFFPFLKQEWVLITTRLKMYHRQVLYWGCTRKQPGSRRAYILLKRQQIQISTKERGTESEATQTGLGASTSRKQQEWWRRPWPTKCQELYWTPCKRHLAGSSQLYEVGIVIPVSPRRNKLKETEGPDKLRMPRIGRPGLSLAAEFVFWHLKLRLKASGEFRAGKGATTAASLEKKAGDRGRRRDREQLRKRKLFQSPEGEKKGPVNLVAVERRLWGGG